MGPYASLWGLQSCSFGLLRPVFRFVSYSVASASKVRHTVSLPSISFTFGWTRHLRHSYLPPPFCLLFQGGPCDEAWYS